MSALTIRPSDALAEQYRAAGVWRDSGLIGDLRRWRDATPDAIAIRAYRASGDPVAISYREYTGHVERFAGALYELGVRSGDVVAVQLPSWWQSAALFLAVRRLGAVLAPIMTTIRPRELERMLDRLGASVCVVVDRWAEFDHAAALREMAPRLPRLRHRVIIGTTGEPEETEFAPFFENTPWEERHPVALDDAREDPDCVAVVYFTSGTSGEPKGALHTANTLYASVSDTAAVTGVGPGDATSSPHSLMHIGGGTFFLLALLVGGAAVLLDTWSGERGLTVLRDAGASVAVGAPVFMQDLIDAAQGQPQDLPALRVVGSGATSVPRPLVAKVQRVFGVPLLAAWGMTETGLVTWVRREDPPDWAAHSDGRPEKGVELDLRSDTEITPESPGRLYARGGAVCLATLGRDSGELTVIAEHDDGWYDTGDLAIPDGRGGIRLMGRAGDRIGGAFMIPVADVESELLGHPAVADVTLVGYPDGHGGELACAVIVPAASPPVTLDELRKYLTDQGMTDWHLPTRLEYVPKFPRNNTGKVRKELLRRWLNGEAELSDE